MKNGIIRQLVQLQAALLIMIIAAQAILLGAAQAPIAKKAISLGPASVHNFLSGDVKGISDVSPRTTSKAVPTSGQVIYVAVDGNDSNAGTINLPKRTVAAAKNAASSGATIVLRSGVYREQVGSIGKRLTIQSYPGEQVWMDGAVVIPENEWLPDGGNWRKDGWTSDLQNNCYESGIVGAGSTAPYPDMLFIDGALQQQVLSLGEVGPGKFYVDGAAQRIYIGDNPAGKTVEATKYSYALKFIRVDASFDATGSQIHGVGFRRYGSHQKAGTGCNNPAQVVVNASLQSHNFNILIKDSTFYFGSGAGLSVFNNTGTTIDSVDFIDNGFNALQVDRTTNLVLANSLLTKSNREGFLVDTLDGGLSAQVAGTKMAHSSNITIRDNTIHSNGGTGYWCDLECDNTLVIRNRIYNNTRHGVYYEVSRGATIASNLIYNHSSNGINIKGGDDVKIFNNTLYKNNQNLSIMEDEREGSEAVFPTTRLVVIRNNLLVDATAAKNNEYGQPARMLNARGDHPSDSVKRDPQDMISIMNYNVYVRTNPSVPAALIGWQGKTYGATNKYDTLAAFKSAVNGYEANGKAVDSVAIGSVFTNASQGNFKLSSGSPAINAGQPLSGSEASVLGVSGNSYVDAGALLAPGFSFTPTSPPGPESPAAETPTAENGSGSGSTADPATEPVVVDSSKPVMVRVSEEECENSERIEYQLNGETVAEGCEASIDTTKLPPGDYELKTILYGKDGTITEKIQTLKVEAGIANSTGLIRNPLIRTGFGAVLTGLLTGLSGFGLYKSGHAPLWFIKIILKGKYAILYRLRRFPKPWLLYR